MASESDTPVPAFSIVMVTYGKRAVTERCLQSLDDAFGERLGGDVELIVVDNASPDDTAELLREWEGRARVILLERNLNFSGGNNVGARAASGEVLVLLNNDTEVPSAEGLEALAGQAREPGVGIVGCRLLYPDGSLQHGGVAWWRSGDGMVRAFHLFRHEPGDLPAARVTLDCDVVTGACFAIRRALYAELGGLDEGFANGHEDVDLCVRARLAGHRVVYRGDVAITHAEGATRSRRHDDTANERLFFSRYRQLTNEDTERFANQFDCTGPHFGTALYPGPHAEGSSISVEGALGGLAPEAAEARAMLAAVDSAGLWPATRNWQMTTLQPRLSEEEQALIGACSSRPVRRDALIIQAPVGQLGPVEVHRRAIIRLARVPSFDLCGAAAVWAASHALAAELVAGGVDPERLEVLPPIVPDLPAGRGGEGVLAILPAHELEICAQVLHSLAATDGLPPTRLLPTVASEPVAALAAQLLPQARLLAPIASEQRFAELSARCDVVVCPDPSDAFERRALIAAATGAAAIHLPDGTAGEILGDELAFDGTSRAVAFALSQAWARAARRELVLGTCGASVVSERLGLLVERARALAAAAEPVAVR
jgi:GT2 family glycosyltransferase